MSEKSISFPEQERLQVLASLDEARRREDWHEVMDCAAKLATIDASEAIKGSS